MVEKKDLEEIKKMMQIASTRKPVKDIRTSILQEMSGEIKREGMEDKYEALLNQLGNLRVRLIMEDENKLKKDEQGKTILETTEELMKWKFPSPKQKFIPGEQKYRISEDGSECDPTNLTTALKSFDDHQYLNRIGELSAAISAVNGEIAKIDKDFWEKRRDIPVR